MDRNRTIIFIVVIVASVAVFLSVGLWWFYPKNVAVASAGQTMPVQYVQGMSSPAPTDSVAANGNGQSPAPSQNPAVNVTNQQVLVVDGAGNPVSPYQIGPDGRLVRTPEATAANPAASPSASPVATPAAASATSPSSGLVVSAGSQPGKAEVKVTSQPKPMGAKESQAPAVSPKPQDKPAASKAPVASAKPAPAGSPVVRKSGKEYWIQVISTTSKDRVEQVRKDLAALGFNGRVMAFTKDGKDYYRLRYGPYNDRDEAGKFLEWVKMIKGMDGSFIVEEKPAAASKPEAATRIKD